MKKAVIAIVAVIILAGGAFALFMGGDDDTSDMNMDGADSSMNSSETAPANTVIIDNLMFQQKEITVKKGTMVTWKNEDTAKHNVIFDDTSLGEVEGGKLISQGEELKFTFDKAGEFNYTCDPHPFMKAKVIVTE